MNKIRPVLRHLTEWPALIGFGLLLLRAWPRLFHPTLWDEDGVENLTGYLNHGIADLFRPLNGYLNTPSKIIAFLSGSISLSQYPLISTLLCWLATVAIFVILARAPLKLGGRFWAPVFAMLVPSNAEVFGVPLDVFWWASVLLFALALWDETSDDLRFRAILAALLPLCTPIGPVVLPVLWIRAFLYRDHPNERKIAWVATVSTAIQFWVMLPLEKGHFDYRQIPLVIPLFAGKYLIGHLPKEKLWLTGGLVLLFWLAGIWRQRRAWTTWVLPFFWIATIYLSMSRVNIQDLDPNGPGPRYFFLPFIFLSWALLHIARTDTGRWMRGIAILLLALSVLNAVPVLQRKHNDLHWRRHVASCPHFVDYRLPAQLDGSAANGWPFPVKGQQCAALLKRDPFVRSLPLRTYPYTIFELARNLKLGQLRTASPSALIASDWSGQDYESHITGHSSLPAEFQIIGSYAQSDSDMGRLKMHLHRGDRLLYRAGGKNSGQSVWIAGQSTQFFEDLPNFSEWSVLEFSSDLLPAEFDVEFRDSGTTAGEWSAIGIRKTP